MKPRGGARVGAGRKPEYKALLSRSLFRYSAATVLKAIRDTSIDREKRVEWSLRILGSQLRNQPQETETPLITMNILIQKLESLDDRGIEALIASCPDSEIQALPS